MGNSLSSMINGFFIVVDGLCFYCLFSYLSLLELQYGGRIRKSQIAREQMRETGILVREAEYQIDIGLFLNEYHRWELGAPNWSVILHKMFLHTAERGWKEVECMVCWGHWGSASDPEPEAGHSAMELVGYWTSCKEIGDIYQNVYLLRRPLGLPSCGDRLRRRTIGDILSSLTDQLHRHRYPATTGEDPESEEEWQPRPNRWEPYEKALRAACQRALDTTKVLWGYIERLSQRTRGTSQTHSRTHSRSCSRSHTRNRSRSQSRSHSRACSQSHPWSGSQSRWRRSPSGPPPERRVTFREPEVEMNSKGGTEDNSLEPSVSDVETWLEWEAHHLGMLAWWSELTAILGVEDPRKLAHKIWASFSILKVRMRAFLGQRYTVTLLPNASTEMPSFWMNYHIRMYGSNLFT